MLVICDQKETKQQKINHRHILHPHDDPKVTQRIHKGQSHRNKSDHPSFDKQRHIPDRLRRPIPVNKQTQP
jgi:hypothetical protein